MKRLVITLSISLSTILVSAQIDSNKGNLFQLTGEIINQISIPPACGTVAWGTVIEFSIIEYSDSTYFQDSIGVVFTCPEFWGKDFFEIGKTYFVVIADTKQSQIGWVVPNESVLRKYGLTQKLWVVEAVKMDAIKN